LRSVGEHENKTHVMFNNSLTPPPENSCRLCDHVEQYGTATYATDDNIIRRKRCA